MDGAVIVSERVESEGGPLRAPMVATPEVLVHGEPVSPISRGDPSEGRVQHLQRLAVAHARQAAQLAEGRAWRARHWVPPADAGGRFSLAGWRARLGWSQAAAAAALGIGERTYGTWERDGCARRQTLLACHYIEMLHRGDL